MVTPKRKTIEQFGPTIEKPDYPGVLGWGFNAQDGKYRIVIFAPPKHDHPSVQQAYMDIKQGPAKKKRAHHDLPSEDHDAKFRSRERRQSKFIEPKYRPYEGEQAPAHMHVIHIQTGNESKFELIESDTSKHYSRLMKNNGKGNGHKTPLTPQQVDEVQSVVDEYTEDFIKRWRELHETRTLGAQITRVKEHSHGQIIQRIGDHGWLRETDLKTNDVAKFPPPKQR